MKLLVSEMTLGLQWNRLEVVLFAIDVPLIAAWASIVATGAAAALEVRSVGRATKVQRTIDLHRDLCTGEVGAARRRFSSFMWAYGEEIAGSRICYTPTRQEIHPQTGALGSYREKYDLPSGAADAKPLDDLYVLLWCFERIETGVHGGALDEAMSRRLMARHTLWWDEVTRRISEQDLYHVASLRRLAKSFETDGLRQRVRHDFITDEAVRTASATLVDGDAAPTAPSPEHDREPRSRSQSDRPPAPPDQLESGWDTTP